MSKALSLKLEDRIFEETEKVIRKIHLPRNTYINQAIAFYNRCQKRLLNKKRLQKDVRLLHQDTSQFIKSFELLEDLSE